MKTDGKIRVSMLDWVAMALVVVGAVNWGLVGIGMYLDANWNLVNLILADFADVEAAVYVLVGLAGLWVIVLAYQLYGARTPMGRGRATSEDD